MCFLFCLCMRTVFSFCPVMFPMALSNDVLVYKLMTHRERANKLSRRRSLDCFEECGNTPALADRARRVGRNRHIAADSNPFNAPLDPTPCSGGSGSRRWGRPNWDRADCEGDHGETRLGDDLTEEAGELKVVEALVAGLLEENAQLGSTVKQLQVRTTTRKSYVRAFCATFAKLPISGLPHKYSGPCHRLHHNNILSPAPSTIRMARVGPRRLE